MITCRFNHFLSIFASLCSSNNSDNHTDSSLQVLNYPGSVQEKERKLSEWILQLEMARDSLRSQAERVSELYYDSNFDFQHNKTV